jgi:hypothetical protein
VSETEDLRKALRRIADGNIGKQGTPGPIAAFAERTLKMSSGQEPGRHPEAEDGQHAERDDEQLPLGDVVKRKLDRAAKYLRCVALGHRVNVTSGLIYPAGYCERCQRRIGYDRR